MAEQPLSVTREGRVAVLGLDDPHTRNSLSPEMLSAIVAACEQADGDAAVGCIVIHGSDRVFAAGADIRMLARAHPHDMYLGERARQWDALRRVRTPTLAAVSGACLGGGLELALSCDLIVCSARAKFGLPETQLGLIPGAGGTQLLTRVLGTALAMDVILAGRVLDSEEAARAGLVSRVLPEQRWLAEAIELAGEVAARPALAQMLAKESVKRALEVPLQAGIESERRAFAMALATEEAHEGLAAFLEKRAPSWRA